MHYSYSRILGVNIKITVFPRIVRALRIDRTLELTAHNANGELIDSANYSRKYGMHVYDVYVSVCSIEMTRELASHTIIGQETWSTIF